MASNILVNNFILSQNVMDLFSKYYKNYSKLWKNFSNYIDCGLEITSLEMSHETGGLKSDHQKPGGSTSDHLALVPT